MEINNKSLKKYLNNFLARAIAGTFGLQIANAGLNYLNTVLLARFLGTTGYGSYAYAIAWVNLLAIPSLLGLPGLIIREISIYQSKGQWALAKGLIIWANKICLLASIILACLFMLGVWKLSPAANTEALSVLCIAVVALPLNALIRIRQPAMQALNKIVIGQVPELLIRPILLILLLLGTYINFGRSITVSWAMTAYLIATASAFIVGILFFQKSLPLTYKKASAKYQSKLWLKSSLPMLFVGGMYFINDKTDIIMLGMLQSQSEVGIYNIATQGAALIPFILIAFNKSLAPTFASLYSQGDLIRLQKIITKSARSILLTSLPIGIGLSVFSGYFLSLFGNDFLQGRNVLLILIIGQLFNAATGSVALLLTMANYEKDVAIGVAASAILNITLNAILIPQRGAEGAALATTLSRILWNIVLVFLAYKRLRIHSTALGKLI